MATTINPLRYARRLEASGLPRAQAEAIAEGAAEELEGNLDQRLRGIDERIERVEQRVERVEQRLDRVDAPLIELRADLRTGLANLKSSLLMWLVPLLASQILALLALVANSYLRQPPH